MAKIIVEVGSTCTKIDKYDVNGIKRIKEKTIQFKKHYNEEGKLSDIDVKELIDCINEIKCMFEDIYICGTSIFRNLNVEEKESFLSRFKKETEFDFNIISQEKENELTVFGATRLVKDKVCVFIGGGGSTEIAIYDTKLEDVKNFIKERLNLPKEKADILILAGGGHEKFARLSGIKYEENTLYDDKTSPIMMDIKTRKKETERYFKEISLDEIRKKVDDPNWWYATRAMCAFALVVAEEIGAKYIIPTDISMVYGIIDKKINLKESKI